MTRAVAVAVVALAVLALLPLPVSASDLDVRIGAYFPGADSNLFRDNSELYGFSPNDPVQEGDWTGVYGGAEWRFRLAPTVWLGFHVDGYGRTLDTEYLDFERPGGAPIFQTLKLDIVPVGASIRWMPRDGRRDISPYIGGGIDAVFYEYEEFGDFIDFFDDDLPVIPDHFQDDSVAFGAHVMAGIRVPVSDDISILGEARYLWSRTDMGDDFGPDLEIDLGGLSATIGVSIRF